MKNVCRRHVARAIRATVKYLPLEYNCAYKELVAIQALAEIATNVLRDFIASSGISPRLWLFLSLLSGAFLGCPDGTCLWLRVLDVLFW